MSYVDDDLASAFAEPEATVPVVFGSQSTTGILNIGDHVESDQLGTIQVRGTSVGIITGSLIGLEEDAEIQVDGRCYIGRESGVIDDGKITIITLVEPR